MHPPGGQKVVTIRCILRKGFTTPEEPKVWSVASFSETLGIAIFQLLFNGLEDLQPGDFEEFVLACGFEDLV